MHEIVAGIAHLHANRVVHGDLKPANVMLTSVRTGCVLQLSDFGLASEAVTLLAKPSRCSARSPVAAGGAPPSAVSVR